MIAFNKQEHPMALQPVVVTFVLFIINDRKKSIKHRNEPFVPYITPLIKTATNNLTL
jgi:hypothetical protein